MERGAFFTNLAQDLASAGLKVSVICNIIHGPIKGEERRKARTLITNQLKAKPDVVQAVLGLGGDDDPEYHAAVLDMLAELGFECTVVGD